MKRALLISILLAACIGITSGCLPLLAGGAAGGISVAYVANELQAQEETSIQEAYAATIEALEELGLTVTSKEKDALTSKIIASGAEDKEITVRLERQTDYVTTIRIRVGLIGDRGFSMLILEKIEDRLPKIARTQSAPPAQRY